MRVARLACSLVLVCLGLASRAEAEQPTTDLLSPEFGQIGGQVAMAVVPIGLLAGRAEILPGAGLDAHLVLTSDPNVELVFPSGKWFQPPRGAYRFWLEGEGRISTYSLLMGFTPRPFEGRGKIIGIPVGDAGRVALPRGFKADRHLVLRLVHVGDHIEGAFPRWELSRRTVSTDVAGGVQMPLGKALAAIWDERLGQYSALSREFEVRKGETVEAPLFEAPLRGAHLVVELQRSKLARSRDDYHDLTVTLEVPRKKVAPPDVRVQTADRIYAIWYDMPPGLGRLRAVAPRDSLDLEVQLEAGAIVRIVGRMRERPRFPWDER